MGGLGIEPTQTTKPRHQPKPPSREKLISLEMYTLQNAGAGQVLEGTAAREDAAIRRLDLAGWMLVTIHPVREREPAHEKGAGEHWDSN